MGYVGPIGAEILASKMLKPDKSCNFYSIVTKDSIHIGKLHI